MVARINPFSRSFALFREAGVLPEDGGMLDQAATWRDAAWFMIQRLARNREEDEHRRRRRRGG